MEGDTKLKTSELLDCKHVEKYKLYSRKKRKKEKSHTYNKKNHPTHRLGEQQKNTHLQAFIHGDNNPTLGLVSKGWHETHDDSCLFQRLPINTIPCH